MIANVNYMYINVFLKKNICSARLRAVATAKTTGAPPPNYAQEYYRL